MAERIGDNVFNAAQAMEKWINLGSAGAKGRDSLTKERDEKAPKDFGDVYSKNLDGFGSKLRAKYARKEAGVDANVKDKSDTGTSVFDPVLCEIIYTWFCPASGSILDPFAGESTKGLVSEYLGFPYTGIELRDEQIAANLIQAKPMGVSPTWIQGDSSNISSLVPKNSPFDLVFTSPPYYDLEVYSADKKDISAAPTYEDFLEWLTSIFKQCVSLLKNDRFFVIKVGEIRDQKTGIYRNYVGDSIHILINLGLDYYNELILVTRTGSLPLRTGRIFNTSRKIGKSHQNILVFFKGNPKKIKTIFKALKL